MAVRPNPIAMLGVALVMCALWMRAVNWTQVGVLASLQAVAAGATHARPKQLWKQVRVVIRSLPILFALYALFSILLAGKPLVAALALSAETAGRFLGMAAALALFLEVTPGLVLVDALRTVWSGWGVKSRVAEDFFQWIYLTLRFYPTMTAEVAELRASQAAMGLPLPKNRREEVRQFARDLPTLWTVMVRRARTIGELMEMRGYGLVLPRGVAFPVPWKFSDTILIFLMIPFVAGFLSLD